jgi:iron complex outermembrane receptor protein
VRGVGATEPKFFDIDHVEVLRGPQGTLYGASSMGGTIRFISNQPDLNKFGGTALSELSSTEHGSLNYVEQGVLNVPLVPGVLAARIGADYTQDSGFINAGNPYDVGQVTYKGLNDDRATTIRASLKFQAPGSDLTIVPALLLQRETIGSQTQYYTATSLEDPVFITPRSSDNLLIPSLTVEKNILGATLTSASSYFERNTQQASDATLNGIVPLEANPTVFWPSIFIQPNFIRQYSEELRLSSKSMKDSGLPFSWVGGVYLSKQTDNYYAEEYSLGNTNGFYQALTNAGDGDLASQLATYPAMSYSGGSYGAGIDQFSQYTQYAQYQSSVFGEFTYSPVTHLNLIVGLRELVAHESATEYVGGYYQWFGDNGGTAVSPGSAKSHTLTPKFALRYDVSDNSSVYANAVEGFRLGGVNGPVPQSSGCAYSLNQIGLTSAPLSYAPDTLWSYELGTKTTALDNRVSVDASGFYILWKNVQQSITLPGTVADPCESAFTGNAGTAVSKGIDIDIRGKATDHLTLSVSGNVTHSVITTPAPFTGTVDGSHLLGVPGWTADVGADWAGPLTDVIQGFANIDMHWLGRSYGVFDPTSPAYDYPSYGLLNATAGVALGEWRLSMFAKNLLNEQKDIQPSAQEPYALPSGAPLYLGIPLRPRTIGLSVSTKF